MRWARSPGELRNAGHCIVASAGAILFHPMLVGRPQGAASAYMLL